MQLVGPAFMDYAMNGRSAVPMGNRHPLAAAAPHGVFPCAGDDRWISIAVAEEGEWQGLVRAMGDPDWARAAEFAGPEERVRNIESLHERLAAWTPGFDDRELAERLQREDVAGDFRRRGGRACHDSCNRWSDYYQVRRCRDLWLGDEYCSDRDVCN